MYLRKFIKLNNSQVTALKSSETNCKQFLSILQANYNFPIVRSGDSFTFATANKKIDGQTLIIPIVGDYDSYLQLLRMNKKGVTDYVFSIGKMVTITDGWYGKLSKTIMNVELASWTGEGILVDFDISTSFLESIIIKIASVVGRSKASSMLGLDDFMIVDKNSFIVTKNTSMTDYNTLVVA